MILKKITLPDYAGILFTEMLHSKKESEIQKYREKSLHVNHN